jgi:REP element-mobilizing transposase RayT
MDPTALRLELTQTVCNLPADRLPQAADFLRHLQNPNQPAANPRQKDWPHAPVHRLTEQGAYMVTTGTLNKAHIFDTPDRLTYLEETLLSLATKHGWQLEAWAVFSNHYHFIGFSQSSPQSLREFLTELHVVTARNINEWDGQGTPDMAQLLGQTPDLRKIVSGPFELRAPECCQAWPCRRCKPVSMVLRRLV